MSELLSFHFLICDNQLNLWKSVFNSLFFVLSFSSVLLCCEIFILFNQMTSWWSYVGLLMVLCWPPDGLMLVLWWSYVGLRLVLFWCYNYHCQSVSFIYYDIQLFEMFFIFVRSYLLFLTQICLPFIRYALNIAFELLE